MNAWADTVPVSAPGAEKQLASAVLVILPDETLRRRGAGQRPRVK